MLLLRALGLLHGVKLIHSPDKGQEVSRKPNRRPYMEYLMRVSPDLENARLPRLDQTEPFYFAFHQSRRSIVYSSRSIWQ